MFYLGVGKNVEGDAYCKILVDEEYCLQYDRFMAINCTGAWFCIGKPVVHKPYFSTLN